MKFLFRKAFGGDGDVTVTKASGRVNLIGEHTDYNDGFVLPVAIDRYLTVVFAPRVDSIFRGYSIDFENEHAAPLEELDALWETAKAIEAGRPYS